MAKFAKSPKSQKSNTPDLSRDSLVQATGDTPAVARYLSSLKFKRTTLGGVDEADVWKKLEKLCELYEDAIYTERAQRQKLEQAMAFLRARAAAAQQKAKEET